MKEKQDDVPWWATNTPGARKKELMEQEAIATLCRTLPPDQAELVVVGYMNGSKECQELFDRISKHTPKRERRPASWRRLA
jgi:hypothetical protein